VVAELHQAEPCRAVSVIIQPNLRAEGDESLLRLLLDNLLGNAWKFTRRRPDARIEFGLVPQPEPAFFVRDNGVGFDMARADKLFGVFQRLHSSSEFPGTGIGLATVQRIVKRHRGCVWAAAGENQGATFYFTLPDTRDFEL
jgi:light-regulated signal transduction histidine kinase (bacteriophytochrome)